MFSKACEYAMRSVIYIAEQSEKQNTPGAKEIAKAINAPEAFTGKILQQLSKQEVIMSIKGPYGGFVIEHRKMDKISLADVIKIFDKEKAYTGCVMGLEECDEKHPCPIHDKAEPILEDLKNLLENNSLNDMLYDNSKLKEFWLKL